MPTKSAASPIENSSFKMFPPFYLFGDCEKNGFRNFWRNKVGCTTSKHRSSKMYVLLFSMKASLSNV